MNPLAKMFEGDELKEFAAKAKKLGFVPAELLCSAVEVLEDNGLLDQTSAAVKTAYIESVSRENPARIQEALDLYRRGVKLTPRQKLLLQDEELAPGD